MGGQELVSHIADVIQKNLEIAAERDPETGEPVLVMREGTYERAAKQVILEVVLCRP